MAKRMLILRGNDYVIELVNPAACAVWGRSREEIIHTPLFDAIPEARGQGLQAFDTSQGTGVRMDAPELPVEEVRDVTMVPRFAGGK